MAPSDPSPPPYRVLPCGCLIVFRQAFVFHRVHALERLMDGMVYTLYFPDRAASVGADLFGAVAALGGPGGAAPDVWTLVEHVLHPGRAIHRMLAAMSATPEVQEIEGVRPAGLGDVWGCLAPAIPAVLRPYVDAHRFGDAHRRAEREASPRDAMIRDLVSAIGHQQRRLARAQRSNAAPEHLQALRRSIRRLIAEARMASVQRDEGEGDQLPRALVALAESA